MADSPGKQTGGAEVNAGEALGLFMALLVIAEVTGGPLAGRPVD